MRDSKLKTEVRKLARNLCANLQKSGNKCIKYGITCPLAKKEIVRCGYFEKAVLPDNGKLEMAYKKYIKKTGIDKTVGDVYEQSN